MCFNILKNRDIPKPEVVGTIDRFNLDPILKDALGDITILYGDRYYHIVTMKSFKKFLKHDDTSRYRYISDTPDAKRYDCNSFATRLHGNLSIPGWASSITGQIWMYEPNHAMNLFVDEELEVWYVEPQNNKMSRAKEKTEWINQILWLS